MADIPVAYRSVLNRRQWTVAGLAALARPAWAREPISLASTEFPPYTGEALVGGGFFVRAMTAAFERAGYAPRTTFFPWTRALQVARHAEVDGIAGLWRTAEREQWLAYSDPVVSNDIGFYMRRDRRVVLKELADIKAQGLRVGVVRGYAQPKALLELNLTFQETADDANGLRMLAAGRMDVVVIDKAVAHHLLADQLSTLRASVVWQDLIVESLPLHLALVRASPKHARQLLDFNAGLAKLVADGTLNKLKKEYGLA